MDKTEILTKRKNGIAYFPKCFEEPCCGNGCTMDGCDFFDAVCGKLADYEDKGLAPEEVEKLKTDYDRLNDFEQSQCAKLLVKIDGLENKKGCEHCNTHTPVNDFAKDYSIEVDNAEISLWEDLKCLSHIKINYCPWCGRKLVEE